MAFGGVQKRADTAFWSGLPPVAYAAVDSEFPEEARRPSVPEARKSEKRAARASPTHPTSFTASLESLKLLSPKRKPPTPRVVEARHEERRDAEANGARKRELRVLGAGAGVAVGLGAGVAERRVAARLRARRAGSLRGQLRERRFRDVHAEREESRVPGTRARANDPAAAAVAAAASRVHALPASVARRLAAAEAMRGNDAGDTGVTMRGRTVSGFEFGEFRV